MTNQDKFGLDESGYLHLPEFFKREFPNLSNFLHKYLDPNISDYKDKSLEDSHTKNDYRKS